MQLKKLFPELSAALLAEEYVAPTELQHLVFSKFRSGKNLIATADKAMGKSLMAAILAIHQLKAPFEEAPRCLVLAQSDEEVFALKSTIERFNRAFKLRIITAHDSRPAHHQMNDIYEGVDIVIGTPKKMLEIYHRNGLNVNKVDLFIIDDAHMMFKHRNHNIIERFTASLPSRCQHILFAKELSDKEQETLYGYLHFPETITV